MIPRIGSFLAPWLCAVALLSFDTARGQSTALQPFVPNDPLFVPDPSLSYPGQWYFSNQIPSEFTFSYIYNGQTVTVHAVNTHLDADITPAWSRGLTGSGVVIGIVGVTGFQGDQPDLAQNYRADLSKQFSQDPAIASLPQGPLTSDDNHDTAVAGIAAARGGNGIGITGAAPFAGVAGFRVDNPDNTVNPDSNQNYVDANYFASGVTSAHQIVSYADVSVRNRSYARTQPFTVEDPRVIASLNDTANNNVINVFAAGNFRGSPVADTGRMERNSLYSAIAVAALGSDGKFADYSNYGVSIFVTAPGARLDNTGLLIPSTDRSGDDGYNPGTTTVGDPYPNHDYTTIFNGTSATAPIVSGIMALGKQLVPFLDVRMAQHALAVTSRVVDSTDNSSTGSWQTNAAGLKFDPNYGFGLVDGGAFVNKVEQIAFVTAPQAYSTGTLTPSAANSTLGPTAKTESLTLTAANLTSAGLNRFPLESVEVTLDVSSANRDALQGVLTSPAGTTSTFMTASNQLTGYSAVFDDPTPAAGLQWTFLANNFWGEDPLGTWKLSLSDLASNSSVWNSYALTFHLGQMVLENGSFTVASNTTADSAQLDYASTAMSIPAGVTFSVRDEFWVNNGTLRVDGRLQNYNAAGLTRSLLRLNGGQLVGNGTIATSLGVLNSGGTVRPGDAAALGTLTIEGNYTQTSAGVLEIDLGSNTQVDTLVLKNGDASLGGTLRLKVLPGANIVAGQIVPIIRLDTGHKITGEFQTFDGLRIRPTLALRRASSAGNLYSLEAYRDYMVADVSANFTTADRELAVYLNQLSGLNAQPAQPYEDLLRAIDQQTTAAAAATAIDAIGPFTPSVAPALALSGDAARVDTLLRRVRDERMSGSGDRRNWYVDSSYADATVDATIRRPAYRTFDRGLLAGVNAEWSPALSGGLFVGASESRSTLDRTQNKLDGTHQAIGVNATWTSGATYATAIVEAGSTRFRRIRNVDFPGTAQQLRSDSDARQLTGAIEVGRAFNPGAWRNRAFGGLRWQHASIDGYTEPGAFGWTVDQQHGSSTLGQLGCDVSRIARFDGFALQPFASVSYNHEFARGDQDITARLNGDTSGGLMVQTERVGGNFGRIDGGLAVEIAAVRVYLAAGANFGQSDATGASYHLGVERQF